MLSLKNLKNKKFSVILIILLVLSDAFIALETSNRLHLSNKLKTQNKNEQFSTTTKSTTKQQTPINPKIFSTNFEKLDKKGTFINNNTYEKLSSTAKTYLKKINLIILNLKNFLIKN